MSLLSPFMILKKFTSIIHSTFMDFWWELNWMLLLYKRKIHSFGLQYDVVLFSKRIFDLAFFMNFLAFNIQKVGQKCKIFSKYLESLIWPSKVINIYSIPFLLSCKWPLYVFKNLLYGIITSCQYGPPLKKHKNYYR